MKSIKNLSMETRKAGYTFQLNFKSIFLCVLILSGFQVSLQAQETQFSKPSWWFGAAGGANFNFYRGSTQQLNTAFTVPVAFHYGQGTGLYVAPLAEFHPADSKLGLMFQAGYDNRKGSFDPVVTPCNCPADLSTRISYISLEPSLRFTPEKSNFYLYAGPRVAFNYEKSFIFKQGTNPAFPEQEPEPDVTGDLSNITKTLVSMQIGAGYDIPLSSQKRQTQFVLSPFISFHPFFGQNPRSIETWNLTTLRIGAALKLGRGHVITEAVSVIDKIAVVEPKVQFYVYSPENIPIKRKVKETFPVRNYVFFNLGSTEIPDRYVLLTKDQVKEFKEEQLEAFKPKKLPGRSDRQMLVYYNILNILGDRMSKNPSSTVRLTGSSKEGVEDGTAMAESIKQYLVNVFGINASRITTEGLIKPKIPSEQPGATLELDLLREGDRRVSISSTSPELLMEFQNGSDTPLKPVEFIALQEAPQDSYVYFDVDGADEAFSSWSLEITDKNGIVQYYGPYEQETFSIPGKSILGSNPSGYYNIKMTGQTKTGYTVKKDTNVHIVLWTPPVTDEAMRFSVIYEFNDSKSIENYEKYLTDIVTPKIPIGGTVILHGYTDIIGDKVNNQKLSLARANDVKNIIEKALLNTGRSDVIFKVYGFGEDQTLSPFYNTFPEERFYNRTVIIDIVPKN